MATGGDWSRVQYLLGSHWRHRVTTRSSVLWETIRRHLSPDAWTPLQNLYGAASDTLAFDAGDMRPEVAGSSQQAWKRNIRNVLQSKVRSGEVLRHDTLPHYRLPVRTTNAASKPPLGTAGQVSGPAGAPISPPPAASFLVADGVSGPAARSESLVSRVIRDTGAVRALKAHYDDACQRCGTRLTLVDDSAYSEGHHLRPLGRPHDGPDIPTNILIVCPNCHVTLDHGAVLLERTAITIIPPHEIAEEFLRYHNDLARKRGAT
jgi:hypothetical protein